ncbi:Carboxypeptidase N subunit 2-like Protein [Tribolium castaneum]|uniref:Carboxypeptidase N subunit 2-like Protein n=1 Tax=Tribolium castaneum TaxID=7070 RepID=D2A4Z6_TRICA|nr:Carboxypeptidase N subunit 2-like Protein [Tribolium castaneum]
MSSLTLLLFCSVFFNVKCDFNCPKNLEPITYSVEYSDNYGTTDIKTVVDNVITHPPTEKNLSISLSNQTIPIFCKELFNYSGTLKNLFVTNCSTKKIMNDFLQNVNVAHTIAFDHNPITTITKRTFANLAVRKIILDSNKIKVLENQAFENLTNLRTISFMWNEIVQINRHLFFHVPRLLHLNFEHNQVQNLAANFLIIEPIDKLHLDLSYNQIATIERNAFNSIEAKKIDLFLDFNLITTLPEGLFDHQKFSQIHLWANPLENISENLCQDCHIGLLFFGKEVLANVSPRFLAWAGRKNIRLDSKFHFTAGCGFRGFTHFWAFAAFILRICDF